MREAEGDLSFRGVGCGVTAAFPGARRTPFLFLFRAGRRCLVLQLLHNFIDIIELIPFRAHDLKLSSGTGAFGAFSLDATACCAL